MTSRLPFTQASVRRAIAAAQKAGLNVREIKADGTLVIGDNSSPSVQPDSSKEHNSEVDKWADA